MRIASRVDANQPKIVKALRELGCSVQSMAAIGKGCPDLLVGYRGRNIIMEIKDGDKFPSERRLNPDQQIWHEDWKGQVDKVENIEQAKKLLGIENTEFVTWS